MVIKGSNFQSYHIIIFSCEPFNQKITRQSNKQESMANSKEKNLSTENISEKDLMANLLNKVFKMSILKMLKELNE